MCLLNYGFLSFFRSGKFSLFFSYGFFVFSVLLSGALIRCVFDLHSIFYISYLIFSIFFLTCATFCVVSQNISSSLFILSLAVLYPVVQFGFLPNKFGNNSLCCSLIVVIPRFISFNTARRGNLHSHMTIPVYSIIGGLNLWPCLLLTSIHGISVCAWWSSTESFLLDLNL